MRYLLLNTEDAQARNRKAAIDDGCKDETTSRWTEIEVSETQTALKIDSGEHLLTEEELAQCVEALPQAE